NKHFCTQVIGENRWIARCWKNNSSESYNHVLKQKIHWQQMKRVSDLVGAVQDLADLQVKELKRALHGGGNFELAPFFHRHRLTHQLWATLDDTRKANLFRRFLRDAGKCRQPDVVK